MHLEKRKIVQGRPSTPPCAAPMTIRALRIALFECDIGPRWAA